MAKIAMRSLFHLFLFLFRAIQDRPHQQTFCQKMATKKREREKKNKTEETESKRRRKEAGGPQLVRDHKN